MIESESDGSPVDIVGEESVQDREEKGSSFARAWNILCIESLKQTLYAVRLNKYDIMKWFRNLFVPLQPGLFQPSLLAVHTFRLGTT